MSYLPQSVRPCLKNCNGEWLRKALDSLAVVELAFNPNTWEAEAGRFLSSRPAWSTEFQDSQDYTEKPCLEKKQIQKTKKRKIKKNIYFLFINVQSHIGVSCHVVGT